MSDSGTKVISDLTPIGGVAPIYDRVLRESQRQAAEAAKRMEQEQQQRREKP